MNTTTLSVRERNMQKRRDRILAEARSLLARDGFDALNLRDLASKAGVTVPTIYNLIGNKEEVLLALADGVLAEIEARIPNHDETEPLKAAASVVLESTQLFSEDEDYYRSAFLAVESLDQSGQHHQQVERVYAWAERLMHRGINACKNVQLLRGRVSPEKMSQLWIRNFRMNCRAWAFGHLSITEFRHQALADLYLILAADAVETFHAKLVRHLNEPPMPSMPSARTERNP